MAHRQTRFPETSQPVVIADGDQQHVLRLERQLRDAGVTNPIVKFGDGFSLQSYLTEVATGGDPKPCAFFLDPSMPGVNGFSVVQAIKHEPRLNDLKVVVFSSTNHPEEIEQAGDLGVHLFLKKNPDVSSLAMIVNHLCGVETPGRQAWHSHSGADRR